MHNKKQEVYNHHQKIRNLLFVVLTILDTPDLRDKLSYREAKELMDQERIIEKVFEINSEGSKISKGFLGPSDGGIKLINKTLGVIAHNKFEVRDRKEFLSKNNGLVLLCHYLVVILNEIEATKTNDPVFLNLKIFK